MDHENILFAFLLTSFAGLSTGIGSLFAIREKDMSPRFLCASLGFSAGVMLYVSLVEIMAKARESLIKVAGESGAHWYTLLGFFAGIALIALIDKMIPTRENPHEIGNMNTDHISEQRRLKLLRMGLLSALAIGIHNFPEGLVTFLGALEDPTLGISLAVAIAIHNIPEGIAVAVPIYYATRNKSKAFWISFAGGIAEPVGALLGYFILIQFFSPLTFGIVFASVAGIMVYISLDGLLPSAEEYGEHHIVVYSLISGMGVMGVSLALFA